MNRSVHSATGRLSELVVWSGAPAPRAWTAARRRTERHPITERATATSASAIPPMRHVLRVRKRSSNTLNEVLHKKRATYCSPHGRAGAGRRTPALPGFGTTWRRAPAHRGRIERLGHVLAVDVHALPARHEVDAEAPEHGLDGRVPGKVRARRPRDRSRRCSRTRSRAARRAGGPRALARRPRDRRWSRRCDGSASSRPPAPHARSRRHPCPPACGTWTKSGYEVAMQSTPSTTVGPSASSPAMTSAIASRWLPSPRSASPRNVLRYPAGAPDAEAVGSLLDVHTQSGELGDERPDPVRLLHVKLGRVPDHGGAFRARRRHGQDRQLVDGARHEGAAHLDPRSRPDSRVNIRHRLAVAFPRCDAHFRNPWPRGRRARRLRRVDTDAAHGQCPVRSRRPEPRGRTLPTRCRPARGTGGP